LTLPIFLSPGERTWAVLAELSSADGTMAFASAIALGVYGHSFLFGIRTS
jgi:hypothetical protein